MKPPFRLLVASPSQKAVKKMSLQGIVRKMSHQVGTPIQYELCLGDEKYPLNDKLGKSFKLSWTGQVRCLHCNREIEKTFNQGYCFPCSQTLAQCDICIIKPELCHYEQGTCRDNDFAATNCNIPHSVYLALSSGAKVGITRKGNESIRWVDQGAIQAIRFAEVPKRLIAGQVEIFLAQHLSDKTNWRRMLKNEVGEANLLELRETLIKKLPPDFATYVIQNHELHQFEYPVLEYPKKVTAHNLLKEDTLAGTLLGIKGQYLITEASVLNIRKYGGYEFKVEFNLS